MFTLGTCARNWRDVSKDVTAAQTSVVGPAAKEAGVIYLNNEKATFRIAPGKREWTVYGSPVRWISLRSLFQALTIPAVAARVLQLGLQLQA